MQSHQFHPLVLREYDIRGIVDQTINENDAYAIGRSFGTIVKRKGGKIINIGYDGRHSSPSLANAVQQGITDCGLDVINVGLCPSPLSYFSVYHLQSDASVMITGSHNPPDYNGFKFTWQGKAFFGDSIIQIGNIAKDGDWENGSGNVETQDVQQAYVERIAQDYKSDKPLRVAWDAGNGAAGAVLKRLTDLLPGEHFLLFDQVDGDFPNHHPDPTVEENLDDLKQCVRKNNCDLGVAFDGDGDRIGAIDENGDVIWCDRLMILYAMDILKRHPGAPIIGDVKCSQVLYDEIKKLGGKPIMWKTGHSLIKAKMMEENAPLAGELSAHIFFSDGFYGYDDGLYCAVRLMDLIAKSGKKLSEMLSHLPDLYNTPELRFQVDEEKKFSVISDIQERLDGKDGIEVNTIDGARVNTPDGWWLLRASNTQDVIVARAESTTQDGFKRLKESICEQLRLSGITPPKELL